MIRQTAWWLFFVAIVLALAGCEPASLTPTDWVFVGGDPPLLAGEAVLVARERAPCALAEWGGVIEVRGERGACGASALADGCANVSASVIWIVARPGYHVTQTALVHELGHVAWDRCGMEEHHEHSLAFLRWVSRTEVEVVAAAQEGA